MIFKTLNGVDHEIPMEGALTPDLTATIHRAKGMAQNERDPQSSNR
uniref:Uncharacterized protein n=1 Tax=Anguilla anguilla TaxID=7936 RepID=A0A0E9T4K9_ANGAN